MKFEQFLAQERKNREDDRKAAMAEDIDLLIELSRKILEKLDTFGRRA